MEEREGTVQQSTKKAYEEPTLVEHEDLLQITEEPGIAGISGGVLPG